jgi:predicted peptidase
MRRFLLSILVLVCGCDSTTEPPDVYGYETILPAGYAANATARWPVILALHGAGGPGSITPVFRAAANADPQFGFILVMPDAGEAGWVTSSLRGTLDDIKAKYRVDPDRMYVTGMSAGAYAAWRLATSRPTEFAAIVLVAGGGVDEFACTLKHIPVWLIHNQADNVVPASESIELHEAIQRCSGLSRLTINTQLPPGTHPHDAWSATYGGSAFYEWIMRHRLNAPGPLN